jgi:hypothetical protein
VGEELELTSSAPKTYTETFNEQFPFYLSIGMTYKQYWEEDAELVKFYRESYNLKRKMKNEELWLQGMYIYEALCDVAPILRAFSKEKKPIPYPKEPYAITAKDAEKLKKEKEQAKIKETVQKFKGFAEVFNANRKK